MKKVSLALLLSLTMGTVAQAIPLYEIKTDDAKYLGRLSDQEAYYSPSSYTKRKGSVFSIRAWSTGDRHELFFDTLNINCKLREVKSSEAGFIQPQTMDFISAMSDPFWRPIYTNTSEAELAELYCPKR